MDKNQIIGWVLIVAIVIGFVTFNSSQEQEVLPQEKKTEKVKEVDVPISKKEEPKIIQVLNSNSSKEDSIRFKVDNERLIGKCGLFAGSAEQKSETVVLENNKMRLYINTNGAYVSKAVLKEFKSYADKEDSLAELTIFEGDGNSQIINFDHFHIHFHFHFHCENGRK